MNRRQNWKLQWPLTAQTFGAFRGVYQSTLAWTFKERINLILLVPTIWPRNLVSVTKNSRFETSACRPAPRSFSKAWRTCVPTLLHHLCLFSVPKYHGAPFRLRLKKGPLFSPVGCPMVGSFHEHVIEEYSVSRLIPREAQLSVRSKL